MLRLFLESWAARRDLAGTPCQFAAEGFLWRSGRSFGHATGAPAM